MIQSTPISRDLYNLICEEYSENAIKQDEEASADCFEQAMDEARQAEMFKHQL